MTGRPWDASYEDGPAPWDVGGPQPAIVRLAARRSVVGPLLDVGCGTGENSLYLASLGVAVLGVDVAQPALAMARQSAEERGISVEFAPADALQLAQLGRHFQTVLDSGLFHTFDLEEQLAYASSLASVTGSGGTAYMLCFSDEGPDTGPHPVTRADLREAFSAARGWHVDSIEADRVLTRYHDEDGAPAWLATVSRI
jgi:SAM-dependent methyltransferase